MQIATWNVNSLKVRLPHVLQWLADNPVDVLCLQETKLVDERFPLAEIVAAGYQAIYAGQKTYNGVAILSRQGMSVSDIVINIPGFEDQQKRVISATLNATLNDRVNDTRMICAYVPNGQALDSDKYQYKLRWLAAFENWLAEQLQIYPRLAVLGDYNIAPEDRDVHDPIAWQGQVLVSQPERAAFQRLLGLGLHDAFRLFDQAEKSFSWWDYRMMGFRRNHGLRIDHILLSEALKSACSACMIDRVPRTREQPSDHTPVVASV